MHIIQTSCKIDRSASSMVKIVKDNSSNSKGFLFITVAITEHFEKKEPNFNETRTNFSKTSRDLDSRSSMRARRSKVELIFI